MIMIDQQDDDNCHHLNHFDSSSSPYSSLFFSPYFHVFFLFSRQIFQQRVLVVEQVNEHLGSPCSVKRCEKYIRFKILFFVLNLLAI